MISGVSGGAAMGGIHGGQKTVSLSDDQRQLISDTLAQFDASALSAEDAESIVKTFSEAGIQPSRAMAEAIGAAGFDAQTIGDLAGAGSSQGLRLPPPAPPASQSLNISDDTLQTLNDLLNSYLSGELSDEDKSTTLASIKDILQQAAPEGGLLNTTA